MLLSRRRLLWEFFTLHIWLVFLFGRFKHFPFIFAILKLFNNILSVCLLFPVLHQMRTISETCVFNAGKSCYIFLLLLISSFLFSMFTVSQSLVFFKSYSLDMVPSGIMLWFSCILYTSSLSLFSRRFSQYYFPTFLCYFNFSHWIFIF